MRTYQLSEETAGLIGGWIVGEVAEVLRHPEEYGELSYTVDCLKTACREMGLNYNKIVQTLDIEVEEVASDL